MNSLIRSDNYKLQIILGLICGTLIVITPEYSLLILIATICLILILLFPFFGICLYTISLMLPRGFYIVKVVFAFTLVMLIFQLLSKQRKFLIKTPLNWFLPGFYFLALIPIFFFDGVYERYLEDIKEPLFFIGYSLSSILILNLVNSVKRLNIIFYISAIIGILYSIICLLQAFDLDQSLTVLNIFPTVIDQTQPHYLYKEFSRAVGLEGDAPAAGLLLQTMLFLSISKVFEKKNHFEKAFFIFSSILILAGIGSTFSRSVWLSTFVAYVYLLFKKRNLLIPLLLVPMILLSPVVIYFRSNIEERFYQTFIDKDYKSDEYSYQKAALKGFVKHPIIGCGLGNLNEFYAIRDYLEEEDLFLYIDIDSDSDIEALKADVFDSTKKHFHYSSFLPSIALELGGGGLILILLILFFTWQNLIYTENKFKKLGHNKLLELTIGIKATFFSHIIHSIMRGHPGNKLFWFTVGLAWAVYSIYSLEIKEE